MTQPLRRYRFTDNKHSALSYTGRTFPISCSNRNWTGYTTYYTPAIYGTFKAIWDTVTPDYFARRKRGEFIPPNSLTIYKSSILGYGSSSFQNRNHTTMCSGPPIEPSGDYNGAVFAADLGSGPTTTQLIDAPTQDTLFSQVRTACLAKRFQGEANFVESFAEADKVWQMVGSPLENVNKFLSDFRRADSYKRLQKMRRQQGRRGYSASHLKIMRLKAKSKKGKAFVALLQSEWLRFRYGITPLVNDVREALKAIERGYNKKPTIFTTRESKTIRRNAVFPVDYDTTNYHYYYVKNAAHTFTVKAVFYDRYARDIFDTLGLTFKNLVGVPWELTHYSFVVDWFANVGDVIYANIPKIDAEPLGGVITTIDDRQQSYNPTQIIDHLPAYHTGGYTDSVLATEWVLHRSPMTITSDLLFKVQNPWNWKRAVDAVALISQNFGRIIF